MLLTLPYFGAAPSFMAVSMLGTPSLRSHTKCVQMHKEVDNVRTSK